MFEQLTADVSVTISSTEGALLSFGQRVNEFETTLLPIPVVHNPAEMNTGLMETVAAILKTTCYKSDKPELEAEFEKVHVAWESFIIAKFEDYDNLESHFHFEFSGPENDKDEEIFSVGVCIKLRLPNESIPPLNVAIEVTKDGEKFVFNDEAVDKVNLDFTNVIITHEKGMTALSDLVKSSPLSSILGDIEHRDTLEKVMNSAAWHDVSAKAMRKIVVGNFTGTVASERSPISDMTFAISFKPEAQ